MRIAWVLLFMVAACGGGGPSCKDAIARAAVRFGNADAPEVATMIGTCEQDGWPGDRRACLADAADGKAFADCLPGTDVEVPAYKISPSKETAALLAKPHDAITAIAFFDDKSEAAKPVEAYFAALPAIAVKREDRVVNKALAQQYRVYSDAVVLVHGEDFRTIELGHGDAKLPMFDREIALALTKLFRKPRRAYLTVAHGEMNDEAAPPSRRALTTRRTTVLTRTLGQLGFAMAPLEAAVLATDVPADATIVFVLAPASPLEAPEMASLERYLDRGGALFVALAPTSNVGLGSLEGKLGLHFNPAHLVDDKAFLPQHKTNADHRLVLISKFAPHATTTGISRSADKAMVAIDAGSLETASARPPSPKVAFTLMSAESSFLDLDDNLAFDPPAETRGVRNLAAAIEGPKYRALVFADADMFVDVAVQQTGRVSTVMVSGRMFDDSVRWLTGEEVFAEVPETPATAPEPRERTIALLELAQRGYARALALAIAAPPRDRGLAASKIRELQERTAKLRRALDGSTTSQ